MATRRKSTKARAGRAAAARRKGARASRARPHGRALGSRQARRGESSREVHAREATAQGASSAEGPALRLAEPPVVEEGTGRSGAVDREAAELAREIEAVAGGAVETLRSGPASAPDRLRAQRAETEEAARRREETRDLPGPTSLGLELAVGALRLVGSMATAPIRIGLAFLRRGAADA